MGYYYDIKDDFKLYPDCWCYIIVGGRNTGKTYSTLVDSKESNEGFIFLKRTNEDVNNMCAGKNLFRKRGEEDEVIEFDLSPFADINIDKGWNVQAEKVYNGLGAFMEYDEDDNLLSNTPIGYIFSLNKVGKFKGFGGLRKCKRLIFDEFIASPWERVNREEGNQTMDLYKTISRDREHKGLPALKLICLANANKVNNPLFKTLQIVEIVSEMIAKKIEYMCVRGIMIHLVKDNPDFYKTESSTQIYKAMHNTTWGKMAFDNEFSRDDFSLVTPKINLKNAAPVCKVLVDSEVWFIWCKNDEYYVTYSRHNSKEEYNLNREGDVKAFYYNVVGYIQDSVVSGTARFASYRMYDVIYHLKDNFKM